MGRDLLAMLIMFQLKKFYEILNSKLYEKIYAQDKELSITDDPIALIGKTFYISDYP